MTLREKKSFWVDKGILSRGHVHFWKGLVQKFKPGQGEPVDWEALLLEADLGLPLSLKFAEQLEQARLECDLVGGTNWLRKELKQLVQTPPPLPTFEKPEVVLLIGVNGSGKTTTAAKLAKQAQDRGQQVLLVAGDTFRAAAIEQLDVWGKQLGIPVIAKPHGSDPASVAYEAMESAQEQQVDLVIIDTAGRQANKHNLMQELAKIKRTLSKKQEQAPHHTWLVVDANTGNNIAIQAKEFHEGVGLTGMIMTKIEGSGKGGMVAAVREELALPTYYLGRGEGIGDLVRFDPESYIEAFFGEIQDLDGG